MPYPVVIFLYFLTALLALSSSGAVLGSRHIKQFRSICLYFSIVVTVTIFVAILSHQLKSFDINGDPQSAFGAAILYVANSVIDLRFEVITILSIIYIFIFPVFLTYIILGLYGYASWINIVGPVLAFVVYSALKFVICAVAVMMVVAPWIHLEGWDKGKLSLSILLLFELMAINIIGVSQIVLIFYLEAQNILRLLSRWTPKSILQLLNKIHVWFSRKLKSSA